MNEFKKYRRTQIAEMREVTQRDIIQYQENKEITAYETKDNRIVVSISEVDKQNGSPKIGDMIARNLKNHLDQWLVAKEYFEENFERTGMEKMNEEQIRVLRELDVNEIKWVEKKK